MTMWQNWVEVKRSKVFVKTGKGISSGSKGEGNGRINLRDGDQRFTRKRLSKEYACAILF